MNDVDSTEIFVYGSLLQGESNHAYLKSAVFVALDSLDRAQLFDLGAYPMLLWGDGIEGTVYGERYQIPLSLLPLLDELEDHPTVYQRRWLRLYSGQEAWVYVGQPSFTRNRPQLIHGSWRNREKS